jgi:hypothetical protein
MKTMAVVVWVTRYSVDLRFIDAGFAHPRASIGITLVSSSVRGE